MTIMRGTRKMYSVLWILALFSAVYAARPHVTRMFQSNNLFNNIWQSIQQMQEAIGSGDSNYYQTVYDDRPVDISDSRLMTRFEWKYFDYVWMSGWHKEEAIECGDYDYRKQYPIDVAEAPDGRVFVSIIRYSGVPASLNTVSSRHGPGGPLLKPYPDWSWYDKTSCNGITSVYRMIVDKCNRLWVLDTGKIDDEKVCSAQVLVFDLGTDRLIRKIEIPDKIATNATGEGLLITPVIEYTRCEDVTVYIADVIGGGLIIYRDHKFLRLDREIFKYDENYANVEINGEEFYLPDGLFGMALSPIQWPNGNRYLAFSVFASNSLYVAETSTLTRDFNPNQIAIKGKDVLPSQPTAMAFSDKGTLFFGLTKEVAIGCWNLYKPLEPEYVGIATSDKERLQFTSGLKVISSGRYERLLMMTNRYQKIAKDMLDFDDVNYRILEAPVANLIRGTVCDSN